MRNPLRPVLSALACTLYPAPCLVCEQPLLRFSPAPVCDECWGRLRPQTGALCLRCGENLGYASFSYSQQPEPAEAICRPCRVAPPAFTRAFAYGLYESELRELIHLLKYRRIAWIARELGRRLARIVAEQPDLPSDLLVVPVPLHRRRQRRRGFNHAERIARAMLRALRRSAPQLRLTLAAHALVRGRDTESQAGLNPRQRRRNLQGAFAAPRPAQVAGRRILLIDDIYTTGATARAASRVLSQAGAESVWVATVARAQREGVALWDADPSLGRQSAFPRAGQTREMHV